MALEKTLRKWVCMALRPLDSHAVENCCELGMPDVETVLCWLELKSVPVAPKRPTTPVRIDHYTTDQKLWARGRHAAGGACFFVLQVESELLLLWGTTAANIIGTACLAEIREKAVAVWAKKPSPAEFLQVVRAACHEFYQSSSRQGANGFASSAAVSAGT